MAGGGNPFRMNGGAFDGISSPGTAGFVGPLTRISASDESVLLLLPAPFFTSDLFMCCCWGRGLVESFETSSLLLSVIFMGVSSSLVSLLSLSSSSLSLTSLLSSLLLIAMVVDPECVITSYDGFV